MRSINDIDIPKTEVKPAELKLAQQLIEQQTTEKFDPSRIHDEVRTRIEAAVQKKVEGQEITMAEEPKQGAQVIDLDGSAERKPREESPPSKPSAQPSRAATKKAAKK